MHRINSGIPRAAMLIIFEMQDRWRTVQLQRRASHRIASHHEALARSLQIQILATPHRVGNLVHPQVLSVEQSRCPFRSSKFGTCEPRVPSEPLSDCGEPRVMSAKYWPTVKAIVKAIVESANIAKMLAHSRTEGRRTKARGKRPEGQWPRAKASLSTLLLSVNAQRHCLALFRFQLPA